MIVRAYPRDVARRSPGTRLARVLRTRNGASAMTLGYDICFGGLQSVGHKARVWLRETMHCPVPRGKPEGYTYRAWLQISSSMFAAFSRFALTRPISLLSSGWTDQTLTVIMAIECVLQRIPCHIHLVTYHSWLLFTSEIHSAKTAGEASRATSIF